VKLSPPHPEYKQNSDKKWTWDGRSFENNVKLACVGYHVVGSTLEHPEMIWATFEHGHNAPEANYYYYVNKDGDVVERKNWKANGTPIQKTGCSWTARAKNSP
jgi:hypothetical protein